MGKYVISEDGGALVWDDEGATSAETVDHGAPDVETPAEEDPAPKAKKGK